MNITSLFKILVAISQQNHGKVNQSNMPTEYKDVFNAYIDLGYGFFEERNYNRAKAECLNLLSLIDK